MKPTIEQRANRFGGTDESKQIGHEAKQSDIAEKKKKLRRNTVQMLSITL